MYPICFISAEKRGGGLRERVVSQLFLNQSSALRAHFSVFLGQFENREPNHYKRYLQATVRLLGELGQKEKIQKAASLLRKIEAPKSLTQRELMAQLLEEYDVNPAACIVFKKDEKHDATIEMNATAFQSLQKQSGYIQGLLEEHDKEKAQIDLRFIEGIDLNEAQFSAFLAEVPDSSLNVLLKQFDLAKVLDCPSLEETFAQALVVQIEKSSDLNFLKEILDADESHLGRHTSTLKDACCERISYRLIRAREVEAACSLDAELNFLTDPHSSTLEPSLKAGEIFKLLTSYSLEDELKTLANHSVAMSIQYLNLEASRLNDEGLVNILKTFNKLTRLNAGRTSITGKGLIQPRLKELTLSHCKNLDESHLSTVFASMPGLLKLRLTDAKITGHCLKHAGFKQTLSELHFRDETHTGEQARMFLHSLR